MIRAQINQMMQLPQPKILNNWQLRQACNSLRQVVKELYRSLDRYIQYKINKSKSTKTLPSQSIIKHHLTTAQKERTRIKKEVSDLSHVLAEDPIRKLVYLGQKIRQTQSKVTQLKKELKLINQQQRRLKKNSLHTCHSQMQNVSSLISINAYERTKNQELKEKLSAVNESLQNIKNKAMPSQILPCNATDFEQLQKCMREFKQNEEKIKKEKQNSNIILSSLTSKIQSTNLSVKSLKRASRQADDQINKLKNIK